MERKFKYSEKSQYPKTTFIVFCAYLPAGFQSLGTKLKGWLKENTIAEDFDSSGIGERYTEIKT